MQGTGDGVVEDLRGPGIALFLQVRAHRVRQFAWLDDPRDEPVLIQQGNGISDVLVRLRGIRFIDEDIVATRASGLSEDQIFELVVCAAIGQAARQYDIALVALDTASGKR